MATITVTLSDDQVAGALDHFGTTSPQEGLTLFREWVGNHANQWRADMLKRDIDAISAALVADPSKIPAAQSVVGL